LLDNIEVKSNTTLLVVIHDLSGQVVSSLVISSNNSRIDTSALPKGVYILKYGSKSIKVVK